MAQEITVVPTTINVEKKGPIALFSSGGKAFKTVPGLKSFVFKGFLLNYLVFIIVATMGWFLLYNYVAAPLLEMYGDTGGAEGFWASLLATTISALIWVLNLLLMSAVIVFSFLVSFALMSLWYEALAGRIVAHFRGDAAGPEIKFNLKRWVGNLGRSLKDSMALILLSLFSLTTGFIPVIGPVIMLAINSYLLGWEVRDPYLVVRQEMGEGRDALTKGLRFWTMRVGLLPLVLALIPWVGWALLPFTMIYLVAGVSWVSEQALKDQG